MEGDWARCRISDSCSMSVICRDLDAEKCVVIEEEKELSRGERACSIIIDDPAEYWPWPDFCVGIYEESDDGISADDADKNEANHLRSEGLLPHGG